LNLDKNAGFSRLFPVLRPLKKQSSRVDGSSQHPAYRWSNKKRYAPERNTGLLPKGGIPMNLLDAVWRSPTLQVALGIALLVVIAAIWTRTRDRDMTVLLAISRFIDRINEFIGKWISWAILISILVSSGNAVIRKTFNTSSNAWLELQWYLFGAAFLLAAAYTLKQNEHIRIDIVYGMFSRRVQHWIDLFGHVLFLMPFVLLMIFYFIPYVTLSIRSGEMSTNSGGLIIWPAKALLLIGFLLLGFQGISEIIKKIAVMSGKMDDPTPFISSHEQAKLEAEALVEEARS
jgi:TRAP-type mannitol/chloroaromatic compound transport system permease small subunit